MAAAAAATQSKDQNLFEWKWIILGMEWHYGKMGIGISKLSIVAVLNEFTLKWVPKI